MIKIDFTSAISGYLCFSIFLVFTLWIFYNYQRNGALDETKDLHQCPYCAYIFFDHSPEKLAKMQNTNEEGAGSKSLTCPRCKSFIDLLDTKKT